MNHSKLDTCKADVLHERLKSLESQKKEEGGIVHMPRGVARAIRVTKAKIRQAMIRESHGTKQPGKEAKPEKYLDTAHFGKEEIRYHENESGEGQGKLAYVILTIIDGGITQYLVLTTDKDNFKKSPHGVYFDDQVEARTEAQKSADAFGAECRRAKKQLEALEKEGHPEPDGPPRQDFLIDVATESVLDGLSPDVLKIIGK